MLSRVNLRAYRRIKTENDKFLSPVFLGLKNNIMLRHLNVSSHLIYHNATELYQMLQSNKVLTELNLYNTRINAFPGLHDVIKSAINTHPALTFLELSYNRIGDNVANTIAHYLQENKTLTYLGLHACAISKLSHEVLLRSCQHNSALHFLNIADYGRREFFHFADMPDSKTVAEILQPNNILISFGQYMKLPYEMRNEEIQSIFCRNYYNHLTARKNWLRAALIIAFIRANYNHPFATSIFALLNYIGTVVSYIPHTDNDCNLYINFKPEDAKIELISPSKFIFTLFCKTQIVKSTVHDNKDIPMPQAKLYK